MIPLAPSMAARALLPSGILVGHADSPRAVPRVPVPPFGFDLGQVVLFNAVPAAEERATGLDLVEPRQSGGALGSGTITLLPLTIRCRIPVSFEDSNQRAPAWTAGQRPDWVLQAHQQQQDTREIPCRSATATHRSGLRRAPGSSHRAAGTRPSVARRLGPGTGGCSGSRLERPSAGGTPRFVYEWEDLRLRKLVAQELEDVYHRVVIEGDMPGIPLSRGKVCGQPPLGYWADRT